MHVGREQRAALHLPYISRISRVYPAYLVHVGRVQRAAVVRRRPDKEADRGAVCEELVRGVGADGGAHILTRVGEPCATQVTHRCRHRRAARLQG